MALRGAMCLLFGLIALFHATVGAASLMRALSAFMVVSGLLTLTALGPRQGRAPGNVLLRAEGVFGVMAGTAVLWPVLHDRGRAQVVTVWALLVGALEVAAAVRQRRAGGLALGVTGVFSLALGGQMAFAHGVVTPALVSRLAAYGFGIGGALLALAVGVRARLREEAAPPPSASPGAPRERKSDAQIQRDVMRELQSDTRVNAPRVGVEVNGSVVTLSGEAETLAQRAAAQGAAHRVAGVLDVANEIRVRTVDAHARTDADVARAVRMALDWDARVPRDRIRSTVSDGLVTLEGTVDFLSQREDAQRAVSFLAGVKGLTNEVVVAPPPLSSEDVTKTIAQALARQAQQDTQAIKVAVIDGRVTLTGVVHSWAERSAVLGAASATSGVRAVDDRLEVEP